MNKPRKHADQLSGYVWQELKGNVHTIEFRLVRVTVYWDVTDRAFRFEVEGFRKLRSKESFVSLEAAKLEALRKVVHLLQHETNKASVTAAEYIPF